MRALSGGLPFDSAQAPGEVEGLRLATTAIGLRAFETVRLPAASYETTVGKQIRK